VNPTTAGISPERENRRMIIDNGIFRGNSPFAVNVSFFDT
jgi:hypothetical protein